MHHPTTLPVSEQTCGREVCATLQRRALARDPAAVLLIRGWRHCHGADPRLASVPGHQRAQQRLAVDQAENPHILFGSEPGANHDSGIEFAPNSPLEETVLSELVSEAQIPW